MFSQVSSVLAYMLLGSCAEAIKKLDQRPVSRSVVDQYMTQLQSAHTMRCE